MSKQQRRSWLEGPQIPAEFDGTNTHSRWPGEKLGLPKTGVGSLASVLRRCGGVLIDWWICWFAAILIHQFTDFFGGVAFLALLLFVLLGTISVALFARTPGQALLGMGVARIDAGGAPVGLVRALFRSILTIFVFPAIVVDEDGRGMHDRFTSTTVIRG